jgi:uncharacterized protein (TIGR02996 family)
MSAPTDPWTVANIEAQAPDAKSLAVARELLGGDAFPQIEPTADDRGWWAVCQGTSDQYRIAVRTTDYGFAAECTCPSRKYPCKHALALLLHLAEHPELRAPTAPRRRAPADFEGLLRAIFTNPDDDTPRLVFADYLDENDQSDRAALIRVQCERSRLPGTDPQVAALADTETELLARARAEIGTLPEDFDYEFRRGFIRLASGPEGFERAAALPARVANLFLNGWVESVRFIRGFDQIDPEAHSLLQRAAEVDFTGVRQTDTELVKLASELQQQRAGQRLVRVRVHPQDEGVFRAILEGRSAPPEPAAGAGPRAWEASTLNLTPTQLRKLVRAGRIVDRADLHFRGSALGDEGAAVLAESPLRATVLRIDSAEVGPAGAAALAAAAWFPGLEVLSISQCPLADGGVTALGRPGPRCRLSELNLNRVELGDAGLSALASSERFPALTRLNVEWNEVTEVGATALLGSDRFPALNRVRLEYNSIPPRHQASLVLAAAPRPQLEVAFSYSHQQTVIIRTVEPEGAVHLTVPKCEAEVIAGLADCPALARLTALTVHDTPISADTAAGLASGLSPTVWRYVDLTGCSLGEKPAVTVERLIAGHRLTTLDLTRTGLKYADVYRIAQCAALASVRVLDLSANPMGTGGLEALLASPHLRGVERVVFKELNLTQRDRARFQKEFGKRAEF